MLTVSGAAGGLYGALFCKANVWWTAHVRRGTPLGRHPILEVAAVTLLTSLFAFVNPFTRLGGTEFVAELFSEWCPCAIARAMLTRQVTHSRSAAIFACASRRQSGISCMSWLSRAMTARCDRADSCRTLIKVGLTVITCVASVVSRSFGPHVLAVQSCFLVARRS